MNVVVVESPAKARTIAGYLGPEYTVLATYGHVRDLREKTGSVVPENDFEMIWEVDPDAGRRIRDIAKSLKGSERLVLATDPDREGEAISWHLVETLREKKALQGVAVERISFNAVTRSAVQEAVRAPRAIDQQLVDAYLARRALDYLVGFNLSPVLTRKIPGARSAGRVQSVAVRLAVERENEIDAFRPREYWSIDVRLRTPADAELTARLVELDGRTIGKLDLPDEASARAAEALLQQASGFAVSKVEAKPVRRKPPAPFITSTLQQAASTRLGFSPDRTMAAAQRLYEAGLITYMRTDGVDMAPEAVKAARTVIHARFGEAYVPEKPRAYRSRAKNAQEAHECIRPTDLARAPGGSELRNLSPDQRSLYGLVWERTMASQMADAAFERTTIDIDVTTPDGPGAAALRAAGRVLRFDGFLKAYGDQEEAANADPPPAAERRPDADDSDSAEGAGQLPPVQQGDQLARQDVATGQHFTNPPSRYSQASLIRKLEELGIGRPSTYATILSVIQKRGYVESSTRQVIPTFLGRLVTAFLEAHFKRVVAYDFTAEMETSLDDISGGRAHRKDVLGAFWQRFSPAIHDAQQLRIREALDQIEVALDPVLFPPRSDGADPHLCPVCGNGTLGLQISRRAGVYLSCRNYPACNFTRDLGDKEGDVADWPGDRTLGAAPDGSPVSVRKGPYGFYFQQGIAGPDKTAARPARVSLPEGIDPTEADLECALLYLALPRTVGPHPEDGADVLAGVGRYGPYVRHESVFANIPKDEDVLTIGLNRAVDLIAARKARRGRGTSNHTVLKELGEHPEGGAVQVLDGRYGPYVKWAKLNASLPDGLPPEEIDLDQAVELLARRKARRPRR